MRQVAFESPPVTVAGQQLQIALVEHGNSLTPTAKDARNGAWADTVLRARQRRGDFFNPRLFSDPAWDMLLLLYGAAMEQRRLSVTSLAFGTGVPGTTALRWMNALLNEGLIKRESDRFDARRAFVSLTPKGLNAMEAYLESLPQDVSPL